MQEMLTDFSQPALAAAGRWFGYYTCTLTGGAGDGLPGGRKRLRNSAINSVQVTIECAPVVLFFHPVPAVRHQPFAHSRLG